MTNKWLLLGGCLAVMSLAGASGADPKFAVVFFMLWMIWGELYKVNERNKEYTE